MIVQVSPAVDYSLIVDYLRAYGDCVKATFVCFLVYSSMHGKCMRREGEISLRSPGRTQRVKDQRGDFLLPAGSSLFSGLIRAEVVMAAAIPSGGRYN